jgi:protein TonB
VNISPDIPPPGPGEILPGPSGEALPGPFTANVPGGVPGTSPAPMDALYVEERPVMLAHPELHYPEVLRQAGIEGRVMVEAVLDTLGRAEPASLRVTDSPNPLFDRAALAVVLGSRYRPGRVDGHAVRVRVQVPVAFTIRR